MWTDKMFGVKKPVIALLHLDALPGDPKYAGSLEGVLAHAREDLAALQDGGVDGVLIANEFSFPYQPKVDFVTVGVMGYIVGKLRDDIRIPFGINVVLNQLASLDLAAATEAHFIRSAFTGVYMGEHGLINTDVAATVRRKKELGLDNLKMLYKVNPESDVYIAERDIRTITKSIIFGCDPDALCVSGSSAGSETDSEIIEMVNSVAGGVPVFCNTGCNASNVVDKMNVSDGVCVGTAFKVDGKFQNHVDPQRVIEFMDIVKEYRKSL